MRQSIRPVFDANASGKGKDLGDLPEWDLTDLYPAPDAPELSADLDRLDHLASDFAATYQGRLADLTPSQMLEAIHDRDTGLRLAAERAFLARLDGSCETPIAGLAELSGDTLRLRGEVLRPDGSDSHAAETSGPVADGAEMGTALAAQLLDAAGPNFFDWID